MKVILGTSYTQFGKFQKTRSQKKTIQENEKYEKTDLIILTLVEEECFLLKLSKK